jgi:hypothetical protein
VRKKMPLKICFLSVKFKMQALRGFTKMDSKKQAFAVDFSMLALKKSNAEAGYNDLANTKRPKL